MMGPSQWQDEDERVGQGRKEKKRNKKKKIEEKGRMKKKMPYLKQKT